MSSALPALIIGIDPGPERSALVALRTVADNVHGFEVATAEFATNEAIRGGLRRLVMVSASALLAVEEFRIYGRKRVARDGLLTIRWSGRFEELFLSVPCGCRRSFQYVSYRRAACHHAAGSNPKESDVRAALVERFGPPGTKKAPGFLYGMTSKGHHFSALAVAVYALDQIRGTRF